MNPEEEENDDNDPLPFGADGLFVDHSAASSIHAAFDEFESLHIDALNSLGESQSASSLGTALAIVAAPTKLATPMFKTGRVSRLQPGQVAQARPASNIATAIITIAATLLMEALLRRSGRSKTDTEERDRLNRCLVAGRGVIETKRLNYSSTLDRRCISTSDSVPRYRGNRKSRANS